ncbi:J domain-containing protein [Weeksellaceae bacterium A-14]|uniref:J domain-containing protein n=1 Tax=Daejeonia sp. YH14 TaxID=3439042 RepID=UPI0031E4AC7A
MNREELIASLQKLKAGYIASLNSLEVMKNWGKVQLEALYATRIGKYKIELLELQIELKSLKKKIQLCHQYINRGETPDFQAVEKSVSEMVHNAYQEIHSEKQKVAWGKAVLSNLKSPEDSMELRKIFRNVAKKLHPDINPNLSDEQKDIWHLFHTAYKTGDLDKLKALEIVYATELAQSENLDTLSEEDILLQTATIKQGIREIEEQIQEMERDFPFNIADQIRDDEWVEEQQNLIRKEKEELEILLKEKREIYQLIRESYE